jgi:hypothetical protein
MPNYAQDWEAVWNPYSAFAQASADDGIKAVLEQLQQIKILGALRLLNPFFEEINNYRTVCRELHKSPNNPKLHTDEEHLRHALMNQSGLFREQVTNALRLCADVTKVFTMARTVIQGDRHQALARNILTELIKISNALKLDLDTYGPKLNQTLDTIRRNP